MTMATDQQPRVQALIVGDEAGDYYEVPWEIVASHRVSGPRTRQLKDMLEGDTTGFMGPGVTPTARVVAQPGGKVGSGDPHQPAVVISIIAILIGM
jgi:hypothetical protein